MKYGPEHCKFLVVNTKKVPCIKGPKEGEILPYHTKGGIPVLVPDGWDAHEPLKIPPPGMECITMFKDKKVIT